MEVEIPLKHLSVPDVLRLQSYQQTSTTEAPRENECEESPIPPYSSSEQSEDSRNIKFSWTDATTKLLLSIYKEKTDALSGKKWRNRKDLWASIAEATRVLGHFPSSIQVENKFKSLDRGFKNMVANNNKTGRSRKSCRFERYFFNCQIMQRVINIC